MGSMTSFLIDMFVFLFVVVDPLGVLPVFILLTQHDKPADRNRTALKACLISLVVLMLFSFVGEWLLNVLRISTPALQISGGVLLLLTSMEMVMGQHSGAKQDEAGPPPQRKDVAVFPLAIPLISGPGSLTAVAMKMREVSGDIARQAGIVCVLALVLGVSYLLFRCAAPVTRLLGGTSTNVMTRVFGIVLAALAFQFILTGIQGGVLQPLAQSLVQSLGPGIGPDTSLNP